MELIADGHHVHPALWALIARAKPADRVVLVSDALPIAGTGDGRGRIGALEVEVRDGRATLLGTETLAGSVIALDAAVRNLVRAGHRHRTRPSRRRARTRLGCSGPATVAPSSPADVPTSWSWTTTSAYGA